MRNRRLLARWERWETAGEAGKQGKGRENGGNKGSVGKFIGGGSRANEKVEALVCVHVSAEAPVALLDGRWWW